MEADICGFFNEVNHDWMSKILELRIGEPRIIRLIQRMLKGGILEEGLIKASEKGTPQGSIVSPLLSNIYLRYALDEWFSNIVQQRCRGEAYIYRFADDFVAGFQYQTEAESYLHGLDQRVRRFGLELAPEKTRCMEFGRFARGDARKRGEKPKEFTFLGFTHYCGKTRRGCFKVKRRTNGKKMGQSLRRFADWAKSSRSWLSQGEMLPRARTRVIGHLNY